MGFFSACSLLIIVVLLGDCQSLSEINLLIPFEGGPCRENVGQELVRRSLSLPGGEKIKGRLLCNLPPSSLVCAFGVGEGGTFPTGLFVHKAAK